MFSLEAYHTDGPFRSVGEQTFTAGDNVQITISNNATEGHVIIDAVQLLPQ